MCSISRPRRRIPLVAAGVGMHWTTRSQVANAGEPGVAALAMDPPILLTMAVLHRPGVPAPAARALLDAALRRQMWPKDGQRIQVPIASSDCRDRVVVAIECDP
ncbi:hypothetical protein AXA44_22065 [Rhodococcus sp. SC4]|nr:hypothetical protein AXA44_22065 [Rhodococcus sp. SC4]